jgi:hypothetical protein
MPSRRITERWINNPAAAVKKMEPAEIATIFVPSFTR